MGDLAVALHIAVGPVVREITNGGLTALSTSCSSSQKPIWDVLSMAVCWNDSLLWLHFGVLLVHIDS
jgi:hypothetical protein